MDIVMATKTEISAFKIAAWCLTENGCKLAARLAESGETVDCFISERIGGHPPMPVFETFQRLATAVERVFDQYRGHVFFMSTGIVVRMIAPLIRHKTVDPAVVVVDDAGQYAISLLAGHLGGANDLARRVAEQIGADPVVTTATDVNRVPAIDLMARDLDLVIENPEAIKTVNMAFLHKQPIYLHDPTGRLISSLPDHDDLWHPVHLSDGFERQDLSEAAGVFVDDIEVDLPPQFLILRPASLVAGIGCNRNTPADEIEHLLRKVLDSHHLSPHSIKGLASIDLKKDEKGLLKLAADWRLPITFYEKDRLAKVKGIQNPSEMVRKHTGVHSVCEAAAILAARKGRLVVPKHTTPNVTVAIARIPSI